MRTTTIHKVLSKLLQNNPRPIFRAGPRPDIVISAGQAKLIIDASLRKFEVSVSPFSAYWLAFLEHSGNSTWISESKGRTDALVRAASRFQISHHGARRVFGDLLMLHAPRAESLPALHTFFRNVAGEAASYKRLPAVELLEVLRAPKEEARDVFIGGVYDPTTKTLSLTRGDFDTVVVPLSLFRPSATTKPDPSSLEMTDYGHTVKLGKYEASSDAILYEADPDYRRRINAKRRQEDRGFGPSLRRLRMQRHLKRSDFSPLASKTVARIERQEVAKPHGKTLRILASRLGVMPDEIESF